MNCINEKTLEGWVALAVCIIHDMTPNAALSKVGIRLYNNEKNRHWTAQDLERIEEMRLGGYKWDEIADIYSVSASNLRNTVKYHKKKGAICQG